ncbi:hypothetical protein BSY16_6216 (plasmid) [Sinorhizobium sp. RAC02]|nr:hypothetical protein BSY16_6216 [Sinorhizobium sp. RAC02]
MKTPSSTNMTPLLTDRLIEPITPLGEGVPLALMRAKGRLRRDLSRQIYTLRTAPLRASIFAAWALPVRKVRKAKGSDMEKKDIEELRARVGCAAVLEHDGFAIDRKESTHRAVKFRRDDDIIIVIHDDRGWFDARSDAKGDVFALASYLHGIGFAEALAAVGDLVAFQPSAATWEKPLRQTQTEASVADRWNHRKRPWRASATWRYLHQCRALPWQVISAAIEADVLREGPYGSMWAKHVDEAGTVIGWEERGPEWRGFSTGGAKALFQFGMDGARRICVTEAAIDALSLAAIEQARPDTLYVSTGGGWSPLTAQALETLASGEGAWLVAATDNNVQGEVFADRLRQMADSAGCNFSRLRPQCEDWNEELKERRERRELPHTRPAHQG